MSTPILNPPFRVSWTLTNQKSLSTALGLLENCCVALRSETGKQSNNSKRAITGKTSRKKRIKSTTHCKDFEIADDNADVEDEMKEQTSERCKFRKNFTIGIASVLRELQKKTLIVALFDRLILKTSAVFQFVGYVCVSSGAHCSMFEGLSDRLKCRLHLKSATAVGIYRTAMDDEQLRPVVESIMSMVNPVVRIPYPNDRDDAEAVKSNANGTNANSLLEPTSNAYVTTTITNRPPAKKQKQLKMMKPK